MLVQLLDPLHVVAVFLGFAVIALACYEGGFRLGRWWQVRTPDESEGPTDMLVGSILALMAFLLAVTMGMASDRFEARRAVVLTEANSIGTTYLRADFLPEPAATEMRELLREYAPLRINVADDVERTANFARSGALLTEMWAIASAESGREAGSETFALFIETLNETIDLHEMRIAAVVYGRVPETVILLLMIGSALAIGMTGYRAGLTGRRSVLGAAVLIVFLGAVLMLVVDLDRPRDGFLQVSQQPLIDLVEQIGPPSS
jgi:MFS family permease